MKHRRSLLVPLRSRVAVVLMLQVAALLIAASAHIAAASPPEIQVTNVDDTYTAPGLTRNCGFTVTRRDVGTIRVHSFYSNGQLVREVENDHLTTTFSAHGYSVTGRTGGSTITSYNPDGSYTVMYAGPGDHIVVPGRGYVLGFVGNTLIQVDADGNETVLRDVGNNQIALEDYLAVCNALR